MKRTISSVLVLGMIAALLSIFAGVASAADDQGSGQIAVINGAIDDKVDVEATGGSGTVTIARDLAYATDAQAKTLPPDTYTVTFTDDSTLTDPLKLGAGTAYTVVSGLTESDPIATAFPVDVSPIDAGKAKVTLWNATAEPVQYDVNGTTGSLDPGKGISTLVVDDGTVVKVTVEGVSKDVTAKADSYTDVFAVATANTNGLEFGIAVAVIPSMTDLIAALAPGTGTPGGTVPDVVDMTEADATAAITGAGFVVGNVSQAPDDTIVAGNVISQDPAAGSTANPGDAVDLLVSSGPNQVTVKVPDVAGKDAASAQTELENVGLVVTSQDKPSPDVEAGMVIETDPAAGTEVPEGSDVTMFVSTGPEGIAVPDLVGLTQDKASEAAESAGLTVRFVEDPENPDPDAVVASQDPVSGTMVQPGTEIVAQLAPKSGDVIVPNIVGMTQDDAKQAVEAVDLTITFVEDPKNPDPDGIVVAQDPAAGTGVEPATEVSAQLAPMVDDAWVIVTLSPERVLTVAGINFQPGSTVTITVADSGKTVTATVQPDGSWTASADLSNVDNAEGTLLIEGTAADGTAYSETFKVPAAGESTTEPTEATTESSGMPVWGWILIALAVIGLIVLGIKMFGGGSSNGGTTDGGGDTPPAGDAPASDTPAGDTN